MFWRKRWEFYKLIRKTFFLSFSLSLSHTLSHTHTQSQFFWSDRISKNIQIWNPCSQRKELGSWDQHCIVMCNVAHTMPTSHLGTESCPICSAQKLASYQLPGKKKSTKDAPSAWAAALTWETGRKLLVSGLDLAKHTFCSHQGDESVAGRPISRPTSFLTDLSHNICIIKSIHILVL